MSGTQPARVLVDTSAWIDALRKDGDPEVSGLECFSNPLAKRFLPVASRSVPANLN